MDRGKEFAALLGEWRAMAGLAIDLGERIMGVEAKLEEMTAESRCWVCGCTQHEACPEGCSWIELDRCSSCEGLDRSPALDYQSANYPPAWGGKVPRKVRMWSRVAPDLTMFFPQEADSVAESAGIYAVWVNTHGAVAAYLPNGKRLGLKPYEFEVIEWHRMPGPGGPVEQPPIAREEKSAG